MGFCAFNLALLRIVSMMLDTSGDGLHKRGYRRLRHEAPIKETVGRPAEGVTFPVQRRAWANYCGPGAIPIEAALQAWSCSGLNRSFASEKYR